MMFIKELKESRFPASSSCFDQIHACPKCITEKDEKESQWPSFFVPKLKTFRDFCKASPGETMTSSVSEVERGGS